MKQSLIILLFSFLISSNFVADAQVRSSFSGEPESFSSELLSFMGQTLNEEQDSLLNRFVLTWDSTIIRPTSKNLIIAASKNIEGKRLRPKPHFIDFIGTLMTFINYDVDPEKFDIWLEGLIKLALDPKIRVSDITLFINTASDLIKERIIYSSNSVTWKTTSFRFSFSNDSVFVITLPESDITCYAQRDSTTIYDTRGSYNPVSSIWKGEGGLITWNKAGYPSQNVFAQVGHYYINLTTTSVEIDSVLFTNKTYFNEPVNGRLTDRVVNVSKPENSRYPKFETYQKTFTLEDIYEDVDFIGGLAFEGAVVYGRGDAYEPAVIKVYRNDTLCAKAAAQSFIFNTESIQTQSTAFTLYLKKDSVFHSDIAFSFNVPQREINTFKSRYPTSNSPYFSSYHMMDMYFDYLSYDLDESKITLSRARGSSIGQAYFESASYFSEKEFLSLMGIDNYHPLLQLKEFAKWYYSDTFPVNELAKWMNQSEEYVMALCVDLATKGYIFFDRINNEVTLKQKLYDYISAFGKNKDYDVMTIFSETRNPLNNATMNMRNFKMKIEGVPGVFLSDSQNVRIYPYDRSVEIDKNRAFEFNGIVQAGMITIFGSEFKFNYDTFKIKLTKVDSIMLAIETEELDEQGFAMARKIEDLIQMTNAELLIDRPDNKSGLASLEEYPIFNAYSDSYVYYNRISGLEGVYPKSDYFFKLEPFSFDNTDRLKQSDLDLSGVFVGGKILQPINHTLTLQHNNSLGFSYNIPEEGIEVYEGKARLFNNIEMSNQGMKARGTLNYLSASIESDEFRLFPDSLIATTEKITITSNTVFPEVISYATEIKWFPDIDEFHINPLNNQTFSMFENGTILEGNLLMKSSGLSGDGKLNLTDSYLEGEDFSFTPSGIYTDSANYNLKSISGSGYAFIADDASVQIDFVNQKSIFSLNSDSSLVKFPEVNYICTMTDFEYDMQEKVLAMTQKGKEDEPLMRPDELLRQNLNALEEPSFFSTHMRNDTIRFSASTGEYMVEEEKIIAYNVNYVPVADALIQPENGTLRINKGAKTDPIDNAIISINNKHIIHDASIDIINSKRYMASGVYDYIDETGRIQPIKFDEIIVDSLRSEGRGHIPGFEDFMLSPNFSFQGDVSFTNDINQLYFLGSTGIVHNCDHIRSLPMKFESHINPDNVFIPLSDKPRDINGNLITAGTYITIDSTHIYSSFLSPGKSWSDTPLVKAKGYIVFDNEKGKYMVAEKERLANPVLPGSIIMLDRNTCEVYGEGPVNLGLDYGLLNISSAGQVIHKTDSDLVELDFIVALDFYFSEPALTIMADEIRFVPTLEPVDISSSKYNRAMQNLIGSEAAATLKEEMDLFGISRSLPDNFQPELVLYDLKMVWNQEYQSYRSKGKIGIGFIGNQAMNVYVDGFVEFQKRRSGDLLDIYLKIDDDNWYWFSYTRGVLMALAGNNSFNLTLTEERTSTRRHPDHSVRSPFTYMVGVQDRLENFLRKMRQDEDEEGIIEDPIDYRNN